MKTAGKDWSWKHWRGLPIEERWSALAGLDVSSQNTSFWNSAVKWMDEAIEECVLRAKDEVADDGKWRVVQDRADVIAKEAGLFWYGWRGLTAKRKLRKLQSLDRFSYDHVAGWIKSAIDETDLLFECAMESVGLKSERRA